MPNAASRRQRADNDRARALLCCFVALCSCVSVAGGWMLPDDKLLLSVYYESNCPDSKTFVLKQLVPAAEVLKDEITLQLVPFGKSKSVPGGFICQHGPAECLGNLVQDCALYVGQPHSADFDRLSYVACEMSTEAGSKGSLQCVQSSGIPVERVQQCLSSSLGRDLQLNSEHLTSRVRPKFVPTITVNGVFDQGLQDSAQHDLVGTLCTLLAQSRPCAEHYNRLALSHLMHAQHSFSGMLQ